MSVTPATPRRAIAFGVFTLAKVTLFTGLGLWRLRRKVEKHALFAHLIERFAAATDPLPSPSRPGRA